MNLELPCESHHEFMEVSTVHSHVSCRAVPCWATLSFVVLCCFVAHRSLAAGEALDMEGLTKAFEVPRELASAMERVDSDQMRRSVELMGQCVQVSDCYSLGSIHPRINLSLTVFVFRDPQ